MCYPYFASLKLVPISAYPLLEHNEIPHNNSLSGSPLSNLINPRVDQAFSRTAASCGATVALTSSAYDHAKKVIVFHTSPFSFDKIRVVRCLWLHETGLGLASSRYGPEALLTLYDHIFVCKSL